MRRTFCQVTRCIAAIAISATMLMGCASSTTTSTSASTAADNSESTLSSQAALDNSADGDYKIAIMYTDASQGEEPSRAYEALKNEYGDKVIGSSFPSGEQEVLVSTALGLVSDESVKALLIFQEPAGTAAAVQACREVRPDVLYMAGVGRGRL